MTRIQNIYENFKSVRQTQSNRKINKNLKVTIDNIQMANEHVKRNSTSLFIRSVRSKLKPQCNTTTSNRMVKMKRTENTMCLMRTWSKKNLFMAGEV